MRFIPVPQLTLTVPERPARIASPRVWNRIVKEALRETVEWFHKKTIRGRFEPSARTKYAHFPRSPGYLKRKKRKTGHAIDLVYSGASRREMTNTYKLRISGTAEAGTTKATLTMRFPFKGGTGVSDRRKMGTNPVARMIAEMTRFTDEERRMIAAEFNGRVADKYVRYDSGRRRIRTKK